MATYTLTGASNWSGIKAFVANDDEVALAGYALTIDEQPTQTGISITTTGTAGTVIISGAWDLSTWSFTAGTVALIATAPEGCEIGAVTGGSVSGAHGCYYNYGTITTATGGSVSSAYGCHTNYGQVFGATDDVSVSVYLTRGSVKFVDGPAFKSKITTEANFDPLQTLYVLNGTLSAEAVIPEGVEVINLFGSRPRIYVGGRLRT